MAGHSCHRATSRPQGAAAGCALLSFWATIHIAKGSVLSEGSVFQGGWKVGSTQEATWMADATATEDGTRLKVVSWNVAAVNNNPFEYWITHPSPIYRKLMEDVESFIVDPGMEDIQVDQLFTDAMFRKVVALMEEVAMTTPSMRTTVERMWESDYRARRVVSQFLKDPIIGKKRLASMPDRVSNTIQQWTGDSLFRPTVINCYSEEMLSLEDWFDRWLGFFFNTTVDLDGEGSRPVYSLLQTIKKSKYPAVTDEEELVSKPLQLILQGVFDAILVDLMLKKGGDTWQSLRREICDSLNSRKNARILEILRTTYGSADVIFLQEAGNQLVGMLKESFTSHHVVVPKGYSFKRNQNSVMLVRASVFSEPWEVDIPVDGWDEGDLLVVVSSLEDQDITLASFHGDTDGLLTIPMLSRVMQRLPAERLLFGMDANTYEQESKSTAHVLEFERMYQKLGLQSCWGKVKPTLYTTFNARTYLQPQLNKAARSTELAKKGDQNPKDFVLFTSHFSSGRVWRDNTGEGRYLEDIVFPTLEFPSDHAAIAVDMMLWDRDLARAGKGRAGKGREATGKGREAAGQGGEATGKGREASASGKGREGSGKGRMEPSHPEF